MSIKYLRFNVNAKLHTDEVVPVVPGGYRDQEEAYLQEVHLQRCGPGPASGHVLVSDTADVA